MQIQHIIKNNIGKGVVIVSLGWLVQPVVHAQSELELLNAVRACQTVGELSARLACYDRVLPPTSGSVRMNPPGIESNVSTTRSTTPTPVSREAELEATVAELEQQIMDTQAEEPSLTAQIVEVQRPTVSSSRLIAADGRVFTESNSISIVRWPETPFNIEVSIGITGTVTIRALGVGQDRGEGRGIRVALDR